MSLVREACGQHQRALERWLPTLDRELPLLAAELASCLEAGGKLLICGNGGSAADAQHLAAELVCRFERDGRALAALALTTDSSALTAVANDLGYEQVFARQVQALGRPGDALLAISTSGRSANVLAAVEAARAGELRVLALTGDPGEPLASAADRALRAPGQNTARVQELQLLAYHCLCGLLEQRLR